MVEEILAFEDSFIAEKQVQWAAFCKRINQEYFLTEFTDIVVHVENFLALQQMLYVPDNHFLNTGLKRTSGAKPT